MKRQGLGTGPVDVSVGVRVGRRRVWYLCNLSFGLSVAKIFFLFSQTFLVQFWPRFSLARRYAQSPGAQATSEEKTGSKLD